MEAIRFGIALFQIHGVDASGGMAPAGVSAGQAPAGHDRFGGLRAQSAPRWLNWVGSS